MALIYELKRLQQSLRLSMGEALRPIGLDIPQYCALETLEKAPGLSSAELARRCFVTAQTMNAIVLSLERRGLVAREPHPIHGRILSTKLTSRGEAIVARAHAAVADLETRLTSDLGQGDQERLVTLLGRCAAALGAEDDVQHALS
jgi:DNA-binding MarR family transcriptional regulator